MKLHGEHYRYVGTICALIVIVILFLLQRYVFKADEKVQQAQEATESTYVYPAVEASLAPTPTE